MVAASNGVLENIGLEKESNGDGSIPCDENSQISRRNEDNERLIHQESDSESPLNSPISLIGSVSSSSISGGCYSGSAMEEGDGGNDGCLDGWEGMVDSLAINNKKKFPDSDPKPTSMMCTRTLPRMPVNTRAWRPDDDFRPQSLPNSSKQHSLSNLDLQYSCEDVPWAYDCCKSPPSSPSSCPICCEDLDLTDACFIPCSCGFRLCLFCHKRILEEDGRCPSCRKAYMQDPVKEKASLHVGKLTFHLDRSEKS